MKSSEEKPQITPYKKGDFIGQKYEVFDVLGMGGFGIVYLVYSSKAESVHALKTFRDEYMEDAQTRERFRKECQIWVDLEKHPYIVRARLVDEISGRLFIVLEYIAPDEHGLNTLHDYLNYRPPDLAQGLRWAIQFCYGMEYAYSKGIRAHRDIKPANIMIDHNMTVKISDFGLAGVINISKKLSGIKSNTKNIDAELLHQTVKGTALGTPPYMPPEQFINAAGCDEKSDIYSFGIVLYQMVSENKFPYDLSIFRNISEEEIMQAWYLLHSQAPVIKIKTPLFPIIFRCLEKAPINRYFSFKELRRDLEMLLKKQAGETIKLPEQQELDWWEWGNKGYSLHRLGFYENAIHCFDKAIRIRVKDYRSWNNKGISMHALGRFSEAIECFDTALKINPSDTWALNNKGCSLSNLGCFEEAISCYNKAIEIEPTETQAWYHKGLAYTKLQRFNEAIECFNEVLKINPLHTDSWYYKGLSFASLKQYEEELFCFNRLLEIDSENVSALFIKAHVEEILGKNKEAISSYSQFLSLPTHDKSKIEHAEQRLLELRKAELNALIEKGDSLYANGYFDEAIKYYEKALLIDQHESYAWYKQGTAFYELGNYLKAIECYKNAIRITPQNPALWYNKALAEDEIGMKQNASYSFREFINLAPTKDVEQIEYARQRLRELEER